MAIEVGHQTTVDRLRAVEQLRGLTRAQLEQVAGLAERVQVDKGEVLAREGRIGREFFLILSGKVAVTQGGRHVDTLGPGSFFGEVIATNLGPRHATVTALSELDVLIIGPREFAAMVEIPGLRDAMPMAIVTSRSLTPTFAPEEGHDRGQGRAHHGDRTTARGATGLPRARRSSSPRSCAWPSACTYRKARSSCARAGSDASSTSFSRARSSSLGPEGRSTNGDPATTSVSSRRSRRRRAAQR